MPMFMVVIHRTEYHRGIVQLEADSEEEARELAPTLTEADDYDCVNADETIASVALIPEIAPTEK